MRNAANFAPKIYVLGCFFRSLGLFGRSLGLLGGPGRPKTKKTERNQKCSGILGKSWGGLGGLLGHLGVQDRAKTVKKSMPKSIENLMPLGIGISSDFIGILKGKRNQVGTKNLSKTYLNLK